MGVTSGEDDEVHITITVVQALTGEKLRPISVSSRSVVREFREAVECQAPPPEFHLTKLFTQEGQILLDDCLIKDVLDIAVAAHRVMAVASRDTSLSVLLQAAGQYHGYEYRLASAQCENLPEGGKVLTVETMPTILEVIEDMGGNLEDMK